MYLKIYIFSKNQWVLGLRATDRLGKPESIKRRTNEHMTRSTKHGFNLHLTPFI